MRRIGLAVVALVSMLVTLGAVPAKAAPVSQQELAVGCAYGNQCFYDDYEGTVLLASGLRCGVHDLRGGYLQNRISLVDNYSSANIYLHIWRNAGYWELYAHVRPWLIEKMYTNDIDRIEIVC